jgi:hypothetical protein
LIKIPIFKGGNMKRQFIILISLSVFLAMGCTKDSEVISPDNELSQIFDSPLENKEKEFLLIDHFGNVNGILEDDEKAEIDSIYQYSNEVWYVGAMRIELTSSLEHFEDTIWLTIPKFYKHYQDVESLKRNALNQIPEFYVFGIYLIEKNPEYKIKKFYYSLRDNLQDEEWKELLIYYGNINNL